MNFDLRGTRVAAAATTLVAALFGLSAQAAPITYQAVQGPKGDFFSPEPPALSPAVTTALGSFYNNTMVMQTQSFEGGSSAFVGGFGSVIAGSPVVVDGNTAPDLTLGRYNLTPNLPPAAGRPDFGKWLEASADFTYSFATELSAMSFFVTDLGDFDGSFTLDLLGAGGLVFSSAISGPGSNGNLLFFGVTTDQTFNRAVFRISQAANAGGLDVLGFDSLVVGRVVGPNVVPEPGSLALAGLALAGAGLGGFGRLRARRRAA